MERRNDGHDGNPLSPSRFTAPPFPFSLFPNVPTAHCPLRTFLPPTAYRSLFCALFYGEGGIRTHETPEGLPVFETGSFNHSDTSPESMKQYRSITALVPEHPCPLEC